MDPSAGYPIQITNLSKRYGNITAVEDLTFTVQPGRVTGFLGPNGAGKTTTLRILLDLAAPTSGTATIGGRDYRDYPSPSTIVGASLESDAFHPGRTGRNHLRVLAAASGVPTNRVDEVLALVGLTNAADRNVGGYSLGMRQRLGLASALLADPAVLVLDEPANGLDPEGIRWLRGFLQHLASEGRTVLLSSHMLSEIQLIAQDVVIIHHGRLITAGDIKQIEQGQDQAVLVSSPARDELYQALQAARLQVTPTKDGFSVVGVDPGTVGTIALQAGVPLSHLSESNTGLEDAFLNLIGGGR